LRTIFGVPLEQLNAIQPAPKEFILNLDLFSTQGLLKIEDERIRLTRTGKLQADHIAAELFI
jgi:oxygen-independent coproporphyrinogen III oxidase